jgi:hypothetical protein
MSYLEEALDELAYEAAATVAHPRRCNCPACRQSAHARVVRSSGCGCGGHGFDETVGITPAGRQTPGTAVGTQLPLWRGWSPPVTLSSIIVARDSGVVPPALAPFFVAGNQVYRITRAGLDRDRPLSIGMTKWHKSIAQRVIEHYRGPPAGDGPVHRALRGLPSLQILVQAARIQPVDMHPRRTRLYEGWLQDYERPLLYNRDTTTFDESARRNPQLTGGYHA